MSNISRLDRQKGVAKMNNGRREERNSEKERSRRRQGKMRDVR